MSAKSRRSVGEVSVNEKVHRPRYIWNVYRSTIDRYIDRQIGWHYLVSSDYRPLYRPSVDRLSTAIYPLTSPRCWSRWSGWNTVIYVKHHGIGEITLYFSFCFLFESFYSFILVASFLVDFYFSYVGWRTAWYLVSGGVQPIKSFCCVRLESRRYAWVQFGLLRHATHRSQVLLYFVWLALARSNANGMWSYVLQIMPWYYVHWFVSFCVSLLSLFFVFCFFFFNNASSAS